LGSMILGYMTQVDVATTLIVRLFIVVVVM